MPTTPGGLPYPSSSDQADVPGDLQALAEAVESNFARASAGLPSQTGQAGRFLRSNGTAASWVDPPTNRNRIINGDLSCWQRGTSFTNPASGSYTADRWMVAHDGSGATRTISQQAFTVGNPITGYEPSFFYRYAVSVAGSGGTFAGFQQRIEDVRTFAGQTVTISFWAKADASRTLTPNIQQVFGSGGSTTVSENLSSITLSTSWTRYSATYSVPSISGKTVGSASFLQLYFGVAVNTVQTIDIWGVQVEAGNVATRFEEEPFEATLRKCQRYYYLHAEGVVNIATGYYYTGTEVQAFITFPTTMRTSPSGSTVSGTNYYRMMQNGILDDFNDIIVFADNANTALIYQTANVSGTEGKAGRLISMNAASRLAFSAEL